MCVINSTENVYENQVVLSRTNFVESKKVNNETVELWRRFGQWLQNQREKANKTQEEVSKETAIHVKTISRIENGEPTKRNTIIKLTKAVGGNIDEALNLAGFVSENIPKLPDFLYKIDWLSLSENEVSSIEKFIAFIIFSRQKATVVRIENGSLFPNHQGEIKKAS
jgi:transcriptional regulator with XRE-family HTH domain